MRGVVSVLGVLCCNRRFVSTCRLCARRGCKLMRELVPAHNLLSGVHADTQSGNGRVTSVSHHSCADWGGLNAIGGTGSDASMLRTLAIVSGANVLDASYLWGVWGMNACSSGG
jgi:hypothetical protein